MFRKGKSIEIGRRLVVWVRVGVGLAENKLKEPFRGDRNIPKLGVGVVVQVKLLLATPASHTGSSSFQLLVNAPGQATEDGSAAWAPATRMEDLDRVLWLLTSAWLNPVLTI